MVSTTSQINKVVEFIAVLGDLIILNLCLFFLLFFWEETFVSLPFSCRVSWMMTSLSLCYLACSASRGRAWNSRAIRADQLVVRVLKNIIIFSALAWRVVRIWVTSDCDRRSFISSAFRWSLTFSASTIYKSPICSTNYAASEFLLISSAYLNFARTCVQQRRWTFSGFVRARCL